MPLATFQQHDRLGEIVIDSPPRNLFSADLIADLRAAVDQATASDIRALLLRADGENFSAGADVSIFVGLDEAQDTQEGIASLQRYGLGHANFKNR
jgi:enoyl-CoA hydratase/carnithine racemase